MSTNQMGIRNSNVFVPYTAGSTMPAGTIISYSGSIASFTTTEVADSTNLVHKDGWAVCNGASIPFATYSQLYARLSTTWNAATNPLTGSAQLAPADTGVNFRIPNLQGVFLRGIANYAEADAYSTDNDVTLAAFKVDKIQGHKHYVSLRESTGVGSSVARKGDATGTASDYPTESYMVQDGTNGNPRLGKETNPKQVGVYYLVKLYDNLANADIYIPPAAAGIAGLVDTNAQSFAGVKTFNDGIKLPTTGGTATTLDYYQKGTFSAYMNDGSAALSTEFTIQFTRVGNLVTLAIPAKTISTAVDGLFLTIGNSAVSKDWPTYLVPSSIAASTWCIADVLGDGASGLFTVATNKTVSIRKNLSSSAWTNGTNGIKACTVSYLLN